MLISNISYVENEKLHDESRLKSPQKAMNPSSGNANDPLIISSRGYGISRCLLLALYHSAKFDINYR